MKDKKVIVTGGSRGIGKAISKRLVDDGYSVVITGINETELIETATELGVEGKLLDQRDREAVKQFSDDWEGDLYALVNNAGICQTLKLEESGDDPWDDVIQTNLGGPYFLTKSLVGKISDGGRIVNTASQLGVVGREDYSAYCASKYGLNGLTSVWAKELGYRGVLVNSVLPGWVATEMSVKDAERMATEEGVSYESKMSELTAPLELKRFTKPEEIASVVAFLLSEDGSGVTGRNWLVNGPAA